MSELRQKMVREMELREFSVNTQRAYLAAIEGLVRFYRRSPDKIGQQEIEDYLLYLKNSTKLSYNTRNQITSGLKFFYNQALKMEDIKLELPSKTGQRILPEVLSMEEVSRLINATDNLKHRVLLKMTYGGGLRLNEVIRLKPEHIDSQRMLIRVEQGKGRKDRYTLLSKIFLPELRYYYDICRPKNWLFPTKNHQKHIDPTTAQRVYKKAKANAKITKGKGIHTLRHCFATHLLEMGCDIQIIKNLLGHQSLSTTMIYLHVSKKHLTSLTSPLDLFEEKKTVKTPGRSTMGGINNTKIEVADIFREHIQDHLKIYKMPPEHYEVVSDIIGCRTETSLPLPMNSTRSFCAIKK